MDKHEQDLYDQALKDMEEGKATKNRLDQLS